MNKFNINICYIITISLKKYIFNKVYTLHCYKNNYKYSRDIYPVRDFLVNPSKLLKYLQKQDLKIEMGKKDLDFCL